MNGIILAYLGQSRPPQPAYAEASRKYHGEFGRPDLPQTVLGFLAVALLFAPALLGAS